MRTNLLAAAIINANKSRGSSSWEQPGIYEWVCPSGITEVSVVVIGSGINGYRDYVNSKYGARGGGGGNIRFKNKIPVIPGQTYQVVVGGPSERTNLAGAASSALGIKAGTNQGSINATYNTALGDGVGGGNGSSYGITYTVGDIPLHGAAGRYDGQSSPASDKTHENTVGAGLYGQNGIGQPFGKGGYAVLTNTGGGHTLTPAKGGAVRIMWGKDRAFPLTDVID